MIDRRYVLVEFAANITATTVKQPGKRRQQKPAVTQIPTTRFRSSTHAQKPEAETRNCSRKQMHILGHIASPYRYSSGGPVLKKLKLLFFGVQTQSLVSCAPSHHLQFLKLRFLIFSAKTQPFSALLASYVCMYRKNRISCTSYICKVREEHGGRLS